MKNQEYKILKIRGKSVITVLVVVSLLTGCGLSQETVKENKQVVSVSQTEQIPDTSEKSTLDKEVHYEETSTTEITLAETTQMLEEVDVQKEEREKFNTELKAAAVKYINNNNEYVPNHSFAIAFFDYDMNGVPDLYMMYMKR